MIQYRKEDPNNFYIKYDMALDFVKVNIKSSNKKIQSRPAIEAPLLPTKPKSSITEAKLNDILQLCSKVIPTCHHSFFKGLRIADTEEIEKKKTKTTKKANKASKKLKKVGNKSTAKGKNLK